MNTENENQTADSQNFMNNNSNNYDSKENGANNFITNDQVIKKQYFILEPAVFLVFFVTNLSGALIQNQMLYQACIGVFKHNKTECQPLLGLTKFGNEPQLIESEAQTYVSKILMTRSLIEGFLTATLSLFLGSWSDKFGRRLILLSVILGLFINTISFIIIISIQTVKFVNPWYYLLPSISIISSGGTCAFLTTTYAYISDVTPEFFKAKRMVFNDAAIGLGIVVGSTVSGYIYAAANAITVFGVAVGVLVLAFVYIFFCVADVPRSIYDDYNIRNKIREFFRASFLKDMSLTCLKARPRYDRRIIWMTIGCLTITSFISAGENNVLYLFLRKQLNWTLKEYGVYNGVRGGVLVVGCFSGMVLLRKIFRVSLVKIGIIAACSSALESITRAALVYSWEMYLGVGLGIMGQLISPISHAVLSCITPTNEFGSIFGFAQALETISPLIANFLYTFVYNATLNSYAGAFNVISACLYFIIFFLNTASFVTIRSMKDDYHPMGLY